MGVTAEVGPRSGATGQHLIEQTLVRYDDERIVKGVLLRECPVVRKGGESNAALEQPLR